jgi:hypothetical protein
LVIGGFDRIIGDGFNGSLSDIRIWDVTRTQPQIALNYQIRLKGNELGLISYWKLDQETITGSLTAVTGFINSTNVAYNAVAEPTAPSFPPEPTWSIIIFGTSVRLGAGAGKTGQKSGAVAVGANAGQDSQGANAIAIGFNAGATGQPNNSIVLNATGTAVNGATASAFFVAPIRTNSTSFAGSTGALQYNSTTKEITHNSTKSFVIDHPIHPHKYLVHACLEGPETGVYYRGKGEIVNGTSVDVQLPAYVGALCPGSDFTVQLTPIYDGTIRTSMLYASEVDPATNSFRVYGENGRFNWLVHGKRFDIEVEPNKADVNRHGDGPYTYLSRRN